MNEIAELRAVQIASEINYIKRDTARRVLEATVEIGRLLIQAKDTVDHGAWTTWLTDNVDYSQATANRMMRLYREYGDQTKQEFFAENRLEIFADLEPSKALALVSLPEPERREFVETHDMKDMTVKDIEKEVQARQEAEKQLQQVRNELAGESKAAEELRKTIEDLQGQLAKEKEKAKAKAKNREQSEPAPADNESTQKAIEEALAAAQKKFDAEMKKTAKAQRDALKGQQEAEKNEAKARAELEQYKATEQERIEAEKAALEGKYKAMQNQSLQKLSVMFEILQRELCDVMNLLAAVAREVPDKSEKLIAAYNALLTASHYKAKEVKTE